MGKREKEYISTDSSEGMNAVQLRQLATGKLDKKNNGAPSYQRTQQLWQADRPTLTCPVREKAAVRIENVTETRVAPMVSPNN